MKYQNADLLLPDALLEELQKYVQGGYLYVPVKRGQKKQWGEQSGCRKELAERNAEIVRAFSGGASVESLSEKYYLSVHAVRKIIYRKQ